MQSAAVRVQMSNFRRDDEAKAGVVEGTGFSPPHCPNRQCRHYAPSTEFCWRRYGSFRRPSDGRRFQCFQCERCRRRFSTRTFSGDYWLKRRDIFPRVLAWASEGPGLRQSARVLFAHHTTVMRHLARGGRLALIYHYHRLDEHVLGEPIALDGFESFEYSQYFPFHLNLAAGCQSWFIYGFTESPLRRKGRMTAAQKRRRGELERNLGRPDPRAIERGMSALLQVVFRARACRGRLARTADRTAMSTANGHATLPQAHEWHSPVVRTHGTDQVHSDEHPAYPRAIRAYTRESNHSLEHRVTPGSAPRSTRNPLFPVNLADLLLRHSQANHRRETIAFSKRRQAAIERAALFLLWRNDVKQRREKKPGVTAAMFAGLARAPLDWNEFVLERRFPRRGDLPGPIWDYYWARIKTAIFGARCRTHQRRYAF